MQMSSPAALVQTAATCRVAKDSVNSYIRYAFNINRRLCRYFSDPLAFRSLQARTATLISGSFALQFFDRSFCPTSDLNLYVYKRHRREVGRWLLSVGYTFAPMRDQLPDFEKAVVERSTLESKVFPVSEIAFLFNFTKAARTGGTLKVQLVVAVDTPVKVILCSHSTCVMNVISFEKAYCLYARGTLEEHRSLVNRTTNRYVIYHQDLDKYAARGWNILMRLPPPPDDDDNHSDWEPIHNRWIDDKWSWVVPLDIVGVTYPPAPTPSSCAMVHDPVAVCYWVSTYSDHFGLTIRFCVLKDQVLRYVYITDGLLYDDIIPFLSEKLSVEQEKVDLGLEDWSYCDYKLLPVCRYLHEEARRAPDVRRIKYDWMSDSE
ncbi:hypothetical protein B0H21DRAFT_822098 [Amylocystis lapponica]|nr:hypothetical protein B0H21DRAFT_822098 [Amylocystis lapponica]